MSTLSQKNLGPRDKIFRRGGEDTCFWRHDGADYPVPLEEVKQLYAAGDITIQSNTCGKTVYVMSPNPHPQKTLSQTEWTKAKDSFQTFAALMADEAARPTVAVEPDVETEPELIHVDGTNRQAVLYRKDGTERKLTWEVFERLLDSGRVRNVGTVEEQFYPGNTTFFPVDLFAFGKARIDDLTRLLSSLERQFRVWQHANPHYLSGGIANTHLTRRMARVKKTVEARHVSTK